MMTNSCNENGWNELVDVLKGENVFLRAEPDWNGWENFKKKRSREDLWDADRWELMPIIEYLSNPAYKKVYTVEFNNGVPRMMKAKGVNAVYVSIDNICDEVSFLHSIMTCDRPSEMGFYKFVLFMGTELGRNYVNDGDIVIPRELVKVYDDSELISICKNRKE